MITNFQSLRTASATQYDVIVIGSGAVGLFTAVLLSEKGLRVLILESGSVNLGGFSDDDCINVGRPVSALQTGRSRTLGGTTNLWGGQLVEFMPAEFLGKSEDTTDAWPISFDEYKDFIGKTYDKLGIPAGLMNDADVWRALRLQGPELGEGLEVFFTRWMQIPNLSVLFRSQIEGSENLTVALESTAVDCTFNGKRISGVVIANGNSERITISGKRVIFAAGTFENARLLLHIAAENDDCPWKSNRMLGKRFQDHLGGRIASISPIDAKRFRKVFATAVLGRDKLQPKIRLKNAQIEQSKGLNIAAMLAFESSVSENLVYLKQFVKAAIFSRRVGSISALIRNTYGCSRYLVPLMWRYAVDRRVLIPGGSKISLLVQSESFPVEDSRIAIDSAHKDRFGLPRVLVDWKVCGEELEFLRAFTTGVKQSLESTGLAHVTIEPDLAAGKDSFLSNLKNTGHFAGGCVAGVNEAVGVVDRDLKIFGSENGYVVGAAVFRTSGSANSTFTAMVLASRLADHLEKEMLPK